MSERGTHTLESDDDWRELLTHGHRLTGVLRRGMRLLPSSPRCTLCHSPFAGPGGQVMRFTGFAPSRKNPRMCNACFEKAPLGGAEVETAILFADIRNFTAFSESRSPSEVAALLNRFYRVATDELASREALIDKLSGDGVMAIFVPGFAGSDFVRKAADAAEALLRGVGFGSSEGAWLPLGAGVDYGTAFVGNVGSGDVKDFTAIGDVVNTASRLQGEAAAGQLVISDRVFARLGGPPPDARSAEFELRGKSETVRAWIVDRNAPPAS
jgi:adenylate cyclase